MRLIGLEAGKGRHARADVCQGAALSGGFVRGVGLALLSLLLLLESPAAAQSLRETLRARLTRAQGETLSPEKAIAGKSGLYTLRPLLGEWIKVGRDHFHEGTDLSLYGSSIRTSVLVWVDCDGVTIDDRVRFRRLEMRDTVEDLTIEERRVLLAGSLVPVSYARYQGTWDGQDSTTLVATAAQGNVLVEVIGDTTDGPQAVSELQAVISSFELKEGATSCKAS